MIRKALTAIFTSLAAPVTAGDFLLSFPVDCELGTNCFIQQYVDHDPSAGGQDFACGSLSYDGHNGTDIALYDLTSMQKGIDVLAAASGVVTGLRDAEPDTGLSGYTPGKECGNGVVIDHGQGWVTQYCHLKKGSLRVAANEFVEAGKPLGAIGLSGQTEFPHLHMSVRRNGVVVDPFAPNTQDTCAQSDESALWSSDIPYTPGGILTLGLSDSIPDFEDVKAGRVEPLTPTQQSPALALYTHMFGIRAGDVLSIRLSVQGETAFAHDFSLDRTQARSFRAFGRRVPDGGWPIGVYEGSATLIRENIIISKTTIRFDIK